MKKSFIVALSSVFAMNLMAQKFEGKYPDTRKSDHVDVYFNNEVKDPYR